MKKRSSKWIHPSGRMEPAGAGARSWRLWWLHRDVAGGHRARCRPPLERNHTNLGCLRGPRLSANDIREDSLWGRAPHSVPGTRPAERYRHPTFVPALSRRVIKIIVQLKDDRNGSSAERL